MDNSLTFLWNKISNSWINQTIKENFGNSPEFCSFYRRDIGPILSVTRGFDFQLESCLQIEHILTNFARAEFSYLIYSSFNCVAF